MCIPIRNTRKIIRANFALNDIYDPQAIYDSLLRMSLDEDPRRLLAKIKRKLEMLDYLHVKDFICHDYALFNHAVTASLSRLVNTLPCKH